MTRLSVVLGLTALLAATPAFGQISSELVASGFDHPIDFVQDPAHANLQMIVEQHGRIRALLGGEVQSDDFLDLTGVVTQESEGGLLGMAFAPDYGSTGRFFVHFIDGNNNTVVARFTSADPLHADANSRFDLIWPDGNPFITQIDCCHYGGRLAFGPDGMLYFALGDGGARDDPQHNAQNPGTLLGKMLRLDVSVADDDPEGYDVPADNPFVAQAGVLGEIWDFGLRNPFRFSFDDPARGGSGALVIADVGQDTWEEFNYEPAGRGGRNFGWRLREGANDYLLDLPSWSDPLTDPTFEYNHSIGECIIGGVVYRGTLLGAAYVGRYFFGDFLDHALWSAALSVDPLSGEATVSDVVDHTAEAGSASLLALVTISEDASGELYYLSFSKGELYRIVPGEPAPPPSDPPPTDETPCPALDPFAPFGGGTCVAGDWLPPAPPEAIGPAPAGRAHVAGDFDGDGHADITVFRASTGGWYMLPSTAGFNYTSAYAVTWGEAGDVPAPSDYDGDGRADVAIYRPSTGTWFVRNSGAGPRARWSLSWGTAGDIPVPGDFDGDGRADLAVYRPSTGTWYVLPSTSNYSYASAVAIAWGTAGDIPVAGDYDGDGRIDIAVFRPSTGAWYILPSSANYSYAAAFGIGWGSSTDIPVPGDYDGDGRTDIAIYRSGVWHLLYSSGGYTRSQAIGWGLGSDIPVPGDFDGDGRSDIAIFRPTTGSWHILTSGSSFTSSSSYGWGAALDVPILRR